MSAMQLILFALWCVGTYFICGIPCGKLVAARGSDVDIQQVGSGNIGTTNVARTVGAKLAALTLVGDAGKGFICTFFATPFLCGCAGFAPAVLAPQASGGWMLAFVMLCCIVGHVFSPYLHFHGGKGIAVGFGAALGFMWPVALGLLAVFAAVVAAKRIVSAASVAAAISLPIWAWIIYQPSVSFMLYMLVISALVIWAHRSNIGKLARGEEKQFSFHRPR